MPWAAVGLIPNYAPTGTAVAETVELGNGVQLAQVPEYVENLAGQRLTWAQLGWLAREVDHVLFCGYDLEHDPGPVFSLHQRTITDRLTLTNLAVWLANPGTNLRFRYTLHLNLAGGVDLRHLRPGTPLYTGRPMQPTTLAHLTEARALNESIGNLPREGPLWIAVRTLWRALTEPWFHGRYADLWTALEALFGPRDGDSVVYRVSQSLAFFLADTVEDRRPLFRLAKRAYGKRSKVVHGEGEGIDEEEYEPLVHQAEDWLRDALVRILRSPEYLAAFRTAERRDAFFERLVFADGAELGPPPAGAGLE
jgi:hypothetical protein